MLTIVNNSDNKQFDIDAAKLIGFSTKSLYVRKGWKNGTLFISQKGNGDWGAGDICALDTEKLEVADNLFNRLFIFAQKSNAIID